MIIGILIIGIWIVCGVLAYGITLGYYQRKWKSIADETYYQDVGLSLFMFLLGPIGLLSQLLYCGTEYGLKFAKGEVTE